MKREHTWEVHKNCDRLGCPICEGGLSVCTVCGLVEGCLTTDCPRIESYSKYSDDIYTGKIDFIDGEWVESTSPWSPASYDNNHKIPTINGKMNVSE